MSKTEPILSGRDGSTPLLDGAPRATESTSLPSRVLSWLDDRAGLRPALAERLDRPIVGGARARYVFGTALVAAFAIEAVTGVLLMIAYSPSATTAWGSVHYLNEVMTLGWFVRGLHLFGSHAMVVVAGLYLFQLLLTGAYRAPRELQWFLGIALLLLTLGLAVTGNPLTWDQKGFWAWTVETSIAGGTPVIGPALQRVVVGGTAFGNATITRLHALHVALLPLLFAGALGARRYLLRRHGEPIPERAGQGTVERAWPKQVFINAAAAFALLGGLALIVAIRHGARLEAPADPSSDYPARPEWFFLWLFQLRKSFPGPSEIIATMMIPGALVTTLFLLPFLDRFVPRRIAHFAACAFVFAALGGVGFLTARGFQADAADSHYVNGRRTADRDASRARDLARVGIPAEGAATLLARDPLTRGKAVFEQKCAGCHGFGGEVVATTPRGLPPLRGADLKAFGSKAYIRGLLENPESPRYLVHVPSKKGVLDGMKEWKEAGGSGYEAKELDELADFLARMAELPDDLAVEDWQADPKLKGHPAYAAFVEDCLSCHAVGTLGSESKSRRDAPGLYGYGSPRWIARMIRQPGSKTLYGGLPAKHQMPPFADQLTETDLAAVVRYLRGDYVLEGGPVSAAR